MRQSEIRRSLINDAESVLTEPRQVLDSLAMRKALVSTSVGVEGIPLEDGREFLYAETAEDFAERVLALFRDPARRRALGLLSLIHI